jgi:imidazolonepropionase-like amidohydrolase
VVPNPAATVAELLKAEHVAVILPLSFPEEPRVPTEEEYRKRPLLEQDEPLAVLAHHRDRWKEQVGTAAALARMEIPFAFATLGLERLDDFPAHLRSVIGQGLSAEQALSALTQQAATIAGLERRLGSLEPGKLGHLIALSAPLEDEQAKVKLVLVDGLKFEIKPPEPGADEGRPGARRGGGPRGSSRAGGRPARADSWAPAPPETSPASTTKTSDAAARVEEQKSPDEDLVGWVSEAQPTYARAAILVGCASLTHPTYAARENSPGKTELKPATPPADEKAPKADPGKPAGSRPATPEKPGSEATKAGSPASPPTRPGTMPAPLPHTKAPDFADVATEFDSDRAPKLKTGGSVLLQGATILTVTRGTIARGSILIEHGKIAAVGPDPKAAPGVAVINAQGLVAMPGIIDTHSHIAIQGGENEFSLSIVPEVRVKDVVTGDAISIYRALAGGTTTARLLHGSSNTIGGQDAVIKLRYGKPGHDLIIRDAPQGVKFALGENVTRLRGRFPNTRMGVQSVIERAFEEARAYRAEWKRHENAARKEGAKANPPPRTDLRLEALAQILDGSIKIHSHCYRGDEILMLLNTAERYGIKVQSLQHVMEGYKVAAEIALHGASCSTFSDWWAYKLEAYDAIPYNAALLSQAGVNVCIKSDSEELIRHLNLEAAKMVKYGGANEAEALAMITINPARELGLESRLGSIEVGKDADIVLFNGHPFDAFSRCELALIDGEVYFQRPEPDGKFGVRPGNHDQMPQAPEPARRRSIELPAQSRNVFALVGGTLHTVCGPTIHSGTLIIKEGKIVAIGPECLDIPPEAQSIDASGLDIWPGLIDAGSAVGLWEIGSLTETQDFADSSRFEPELRTSVALRPDSEHLPVTRANGVLATYVHPTGGLISGQGCVINLRGWVPRELLIQDQVALHVTIPAFVPRPAVGHRRGPRPGQAGGETSPDPHTRRKEQLEAIRDEFRKAARYGDIVAQARLRGLPPPAFDLRLSALFPYAKGQKPVVFLANHRTEILDALAIAKELKLKAVISGALEAWKVAAAIKEADVPVIVAGTLNVPSSDYDPCDASYANPARLHAAGVTVAIRSNASGPSAATAGRNLPYEAATAIAFGLPEDVALQAVTLTPARILGVADRIGSLGVGKRANVVVTAGHILQPTSAVLLLFIDGKPVAPESRHTQLYGKYAQRLSEVKAGLAPLGLDRSGTVPAQVPGRAAASPSPASP